MIMTPLKIAAQQALDFLSRVRIWEEGTPDLHDVKKDLRVALEAEQAQAVAVEPVAWWIPKAEQFCLPDPNGQRPFAKAWEPLYSRPAPPPYDQQAIELCGACGWKAIMPGEPCFVCNMQTEQVAVPAWTLTADKMPDPCMNVLAYTGKKQPIRAMWVPAKTLEDTGDGGFGEYDEDTDMSYWPEAWYETNAHEETHWMVDEPVTHWMPLPEVPKGAKP